jgi:toxin ParE1/3/4
VRKIQPTRASIADFDAIYDYIAKEDPRAAADVLRALDHSVQLLAHEPKLGRKYRSGRHHLRLLVHGHYLVFYRERPGIVEVIRVLDGRRNIPDILDEI